MVDLGVSLWVLGSILLDVDDEVGSEEGRRVCGAETTNLRG